MFRSKNKNHSMSGWIWRRFIASYRQQTPGASPPYAYIATPNVGLVGGGNMNQAVYSQPLIASCTSDVAQLVVNAGVISQDETGTQSNQTGTLNTYIPAPNRRIAIKKISGVIDLFPFAVTLSLADILYCHVGIMKREFSVGGAGTAATAVQATVPYPNVIQDLEGKNSRPLLYRRHHWYFATFAGMTGNVLIQGSNWSCPIKINFRQPLVLDMDEALYLTIVADLQGTQVAGLYTGQYNIGIMPYLSYLVKTL